ncbi:hypothetical protein EZV62_027092 [Acer yangbiense]|uniref:Uncharacterized protein n=1 Tax=Acer yangbiense TaxID=1000413 RepID=A0A5C7GSU3_9ROSI|nr:hypothetical protein EZV62_027092 [Acer yangbiense]
MATPWKIINLSRKIRASSDIKVRNFSANSASSGSTSKNNNMTTSNFMGNWSSGSTTSKNNNVSVADTPLGNFSKSFMMNFNPQKFREFSGFKVESFMANSSSSSANFAVSSEDSTRKTTPLGNFTETFMMMMLNGCKSALVSSSSTSTPTPTPTSSKSKGRKGCRCVKVTEEEIIEATKAAFVHNFIAALLHGYNMNVVGARNTAFWWAKSENCHSSKSYI